MRSPAGGAGATRRRPRPRTGWALRRPHRARSPRRYRRNSQLARRETIRDSQRHRHPPPREAHRSHTHNPSTPRLSRIAHLPCAAPGSGALNDNQASVAANGNPQPPSTVNGPKHLPGPDETDRPLGRGGHPSGHRIRHRGGAVGGPVEEAGAVRPRKASSSALTPNRSATKGGNTSREPSHVDSAPLSRMWSPQHLGAASVRFDPSFPMATVCATNKTGYT